MTTDADAAAQLIERARGPVTVFVTYGSLPRIRHIHEQYRIPASDLAGQPASPVPAASDADDPRHNRNGASPGRWRQEAAPCRNHRHDSQHPSSPHPPSR